MNKPHANFQKYRMNHSFKKKIMKIEQNTRLHVYFPPERPSVHIELIKYRQLLRICTDE